MALTAWRGTPAVRLDHGAKPNSPMRTIHVDTRSGKVALVILVAQRCQLEE